MMSRAKTPAPTVVLEVSPRVAKLLAASGSPITLQRINAMVVPEETDDPVAALRTLLGAGSLGASRVGLLVGRETFSLRTLELPSTNPKELASMLELQLGKLTPYPRGDILAGWTIIGSFREGYTSVLLAIARKTLIENVLQLLKTKGITTQWVGVSTEGLESWWALVTKQDPGIAPGQLIALLDVDAISTDCAILSGGRVVFTHSVTIGAEQLASGGEAATLRWVGELVRLPRILAHEEVKGVIGRGVVTGLTAGLEHVLEQLTTQWGVPVEPIDTFAPCTLSSAIRQSPTATRVSYTALAGIVASGTPAHIDLIPPEARVSQELDVRSRHLARLAGTLAALLVLTAVLSIERIVTIRRDLAAFQQRLAVLEQTSKQVIERRQMMQRVREWLDPSHGPLEVLRVVASASSEGMAITQLSFAEHAPLKIHGTADAVRVPYEFVDRLKQQHSPVTGSGCYVANAKSTGSRGAEFEVVCGKSES